MKPEVYELYKKFLTWFGDLYMATEPPLCKYKQIEGMLDCILPGDVICRGYNYYLDSYFIPGEYTHSGIIINRREIVHSIAEGVQSIHPIDFIKDVDRFIVLRPSYDVGLDTHWRTRERTVDRAIWHCDYNKTEYDFTFKDDSKFYCHEFTADCLAQAGLLFQEPTNHSVYGLLSFIDSYILQRILLLCVR